MLQKTDDGSKLSIVFILSSKRPLGQIKSYPHLISTSIDT